MQVYLAKSGRQFISKSVLLLFINLIICFAVHAQQSDTSIYFFRSVSKTFAVKVNALAESDFFRLVYSSDDEPNKFIIKEFYRNGTIKLLGASAAVAAPNKNTCGDAIVKFDGDRAIYGTNGKTMATSHFVDGIKNGDEYLFYPDGKIYCDVKHEAPDRSKLTPYSYITYHETDPLYWECYDSKGNKLCENGVGEWIQYSDDFSTIVMHGPVKKGLRDGTWFGNTLRADSIKYKAVYKKGVVVSGTGFDKNGTAYTFKTINEKAECAKGDVFSFLLTVYNSVQLPQGFHRSAIEKMLFSFIVEKDGTLTNFQAIGNAAPEIKEAIAALKINKTWIPARYYGVPFRTRVVLPFTFKTNREEKVIAGNYDDVTNQQTPQQAILSINKSVYYNQNMIDF